MHYNIIIIMRSIINIKIGRAMGVANLKWTNTVAQAITDRKDPYRNL